MDVYQKGWDDAHNVYNDDLAIKVDPDTVEADARSESLGVATQPWLVQSGGQSVCEENSSSRVLSKAKVVVKHALDKLIAGLVVVGNVLKSLINWRKEGVVCVGAVEQLAKLVVLPDQLEKLLGMVALLKNLQNSQIRQIQS